MPSLQTDSFADLVWHYAKTVLSFSFTLSVVFGLVVGAYLIESGLLSPDLSLKAVTVFLLGKLPSCLVAFFLLLRLTFVARFHSPTDQSLEVQMLHPMRHMLASVWVGVLGWELSILGGALGLAAGVFLVDPAEIHAIGAYLSAEFDMTIALRGLLRTMLQALTVSWLLYLESVVMRYWQNDKETRMTQFIFLGLIALMTIEVVDTVLFMN